MGQLLFTVEVARELESIVIGRVLQVVVALASDELLHGLCRRPLRLQRVTFIFCAHIDALAQDGKAVGCLLVEPVDLLRNVVLVLLLLRIRQLVAVLSLDIVPQLGGQLSAPIKLLRALVEQVVVAKDLADFGQVDHIAVMEAVIVHLVLIVDVLGEIKQVQLRDIIVLVVTQKHADGFNFFAPHGTRYDRTLLEGLDKR